MRKSQVIEHFGGVSKPPVFLGSPTRLFADGERLFLRSKRSLSNELLKASSSTTPAFIRSLQIRHLGRNHRYKGLAVGIEPEWKVDKQPAWLVAAIKRRSPNCLVDIQKLLSGWV